MNRFSSCHPAVSALYFLSVLAVPMFSIRPVLSALALAGGAAFCAVNEGGRSFGRSLGLYLPLFAVITLTNPLFSHNGVTPLFFLNGNPVTLEAVLYGLNLAAVLLAVLYWFRGFHAVMTSDKLLYLLGGAFPKLALVLSSALRFVPLLAAQAKRIRQTQKALGLFARDGWTDRLRAAVRVCSALITWSFENAVDTGASMKARGYGLKGRSRFALFRFTPSDGVLLGLIAVSDAVLLASMAVGGADFAFYPGLSAPPLCLPTLSAAAAYGLLSFLPLILEVKENLLWTYYRSKI